MKTCSNKQSEKPLKIDCPFKYVNKTNLTDFVEWFMKNKELETNSHHILTYLRTHKLLDPLNETKPKRKMSCPQISAILKRDPRFKKIRPRRYYMRMGWTLRDNTALNPLAFPYKITKKRFGDFVEYYMMHIHPNPTSYEIMAHIHEHELQHKSTRIIPGAILARDPRFGIKGNPGRWYLRKKSEEE